MRSKRPLNLAAPLLVLAAVAPLATGCSSGPGGSGLMTALSRVADSASTRGYVVYDDTASLTALAGGSQQWTVKGFASLRGLGTGDLVSSGPLLAGDTGISLLAEDYAITAGLPPKEVTVISGGQDTSLVTSKLTKQGWKQDGGDLVYPVAQLTDPSAGTNPDLQVFALSMNRVRPSGSDVIAGEQAADLSQADSPSGQTLAGDPGISALAGCLGDVVAAMFSTGKGLGANPVEIAVGVLRPASNTATAQAVACVQWPAQAAAAQYAAALRTALASGESLSRGAPWSAVLPHSSVTVIGGSQNIVQWQASTPGNVSQVFQMVESQDLPALPPCGNPRLTPAEAAALGCPHS